MRRGAVDHGFHRIAARVKLALGGIIGNHRHAGNFRQSLGDGEEILIVHLLARQHRDRLRHINTTHRHFACDGYRAAGIGTRAIRDGGLIEITSAGDAIAKLHLNIGKRGLIDRLGCGLPERQSNSTGDKRRE